LPRISPPSQHAVILSGVGAGSKPVRAGRAHTWGNSGMNTLRKGAMALVGCIQPLGGWANVTTKLVVMLGFVVCAALLSSCASTQPSSGGPSAAAPKVIACNPGYYFCPGEVVGCCPNGWGCGSTQCINPRNLRAARTCRPGHYFCPGVVIGCCPNGWGCASTHCIRPARQTNL
jgi:hypothetical protein